MDAIKLLMADHRALQSLVNKVHETKEKAVKTRHDLFAKIKYEASIHEKAEEKFLYNLLKKYKISRPNALEHKVEVGLMNSLLRQLSQTDPSSELWTAKFTVLKEITDHHIEEEESEFFPQAVRLIPYEDLQKVGEQIEAFKKQHKAR